MKLCYLKTKNILSFGNEGVELKFNPYNVFAGPNDTGKTNLFRALKLIEDAFGFRTLSFNGVPFQGETP